MIAGEEDIPVSGPIISRMLLYPLLLILGEVDTIQTGY